MGFESLTNALSTISSILSGAKGLGTAFVLAGLVIVLVIFAGIGIWFLVNLIKHLPKMTPTEFLKFVLIFAATLIVVGIILP